MKNKKFESFKKLSVLSETELEGIVGGGKSDGSFAENFGMGLLIPGSGVFALSDNMLSNKEKAGIIAGNAVTLSALIVTSGAIGIGLEHGIKKIVKWAKNK